MVLKSTNQTFSGVPKHVVNGYINEVNQKCIDEESEIGNFKTVEVNQANVDVVNNKRNTLHNLDLSRYWIDHICDIL